MPPITSPPPTGRERDNSSSLITIVKAQIVFLLSTLTEENFDRNQAEIRHMSETNAETYSHFLRRLIAASQQRNSAQNFDGSANLPLRLLMQEVQRLARDPFLADRFRDGIDKGEGEIFRSFDLLRFSDWVGLRPLEKLILAASIVSASARRELAMQAHQIIRQEWTNAVLALCTRPSFDHSDLSPSQVAKLLSNLLSDPPADSPVLDTNQRHELLVAAWSKYGSDVMSPILQKIFPTISLPPGTSLVQALNQLGPELTSDPDVVRALLLRFGVSDASPPQTMQVVEIVGTLARNAVEGKQLCDVVALTRALGSFRTNLHWPTIIRALDEPDRSGVDTATLKLIIAVLLNAPRDSEPHAVSGFWSIWNNTTWQVKLLDALLSLPNDTFNFVSLPGRRTVTVEDVAGASPTIKALAANVQGHTWNSLDLIEALVKLGDSEVPETRSSVRELLDKAVRISAELVHMGLLQVPKPWGTTQREYSEKLLSMFLAGHPNHQLVFMRIWQIDPTYLTTAFREFYEESPLNITRILDVAQDLKILDALLDVRPFTFSLDVAALASRREYLNLDKWLADNVNNHGIEFLRSVIDFLDIKVNNAQDAGTESRTMALNPNTIVIIIRTLRTNAAMMSPDDITYFHEVRNKCCQLWPRLMNLSPGSDVEPGLSVASFSPEVEAEVEGIYRQMYDEQITPDQVIGLLQRSAKSQSSRDHEIFACTLHSLFDEYKFFNSSYPPRELNITAHLFGSIIQYEVISSTPLGIAVRFVLDALRYPADSSLFRFGVTALSKFESRLYKWPDLCRTLLSLPNLQETRPDLMETAQKIVAQAESGDYGPDGSLDLLPPPFSSIRPDALSDPFTEPDEEQLDKILFIINNLAPSNFTQKTAEMQERFKDEHSRWLANYLVDQRVSTEPNNHDLYLRFLDALKRKPLFRLVIHETIVKSANLLNSDQTVSSSADRTVLKNLASWLGALTLARNRPIKHKNISFKDLLLEGYENNRLIVAIPFVCKVLEHGKHSIVFKPPNPWLMGVINLLAELYHYAELRLNLKFEIEVTCRALEIELDKVQATTILRNRPISDALAPPQLPDYVQDIDSMPTGAYESTTTPAQQTLIPALSSSSPSPQVSLAIENVLSGLPNLVVVNTQLGPYASNAAFKRACQIAVDRAVREIIMPVIERSVTIAAISTRELVTKDFALEANEEKMRTAAHLMASNLAGNLAMVTCKEPLKSNMATHLRTMLNEHGFAEIIPEAAIQLIVTDNVDVACTVIEKAAMDRAVAEVDEAFADAYAVRRTHRETRPGQPFWDTNTQLSPFLASLPDILRIKPTGLQFQQTRVYDAFGPDGGRLPVGRPGAINYDSNATLSTSPAPDVPTSYVWTGAKCMERFQQFAAEVDRILVNGSLSPAEIQTFVRQVMQTIGRSVNRELTALAFSQKTVQLLFKTQSQSGRELYVLLLSKLCDSWPKVNKEAIDWLLYSDDERKFNVPVTIALVKSRLISAPDYDLPLSKMVAPNFPPALVTFSVALLREAIFGEQPCATRNHFANTIEALSRAVTSNKATPEILRLLEDVGVRRPAPVETGDSSTGDIYDTLLHHFTDWVRIYQRAPTSDKAFIGWVQGLTQQGILRGEDLSSLFYRVCIESSIQMHNKCIASGELSLAFQPIDALARLITLMIKYNGDASSVPVKVHYLTKILSIVVLVLARAHEDEMVEFKQRPFFRLFSSLLANLHEIEAQLGVTYYPLLFAICDTFNTLQPIFFPGFAFSWMSLISHRLFLPKLLSAENREGWSAFHRLLHSLFKFMAPFLKTATLHNAVGTLYRGSLSLLLVLLHDFPEFLSENFFSLSDAIPPRCVQFRNVILSAYPPQLSIPDPYPRDLKLESLPEMGPIPPVPNDLATTLPEELRASLEGYLANRLALEAVILAVKQAMFLPNVNVDDTSIDRYNVHMMNTILYFVGVSSVAQAKARTGSSLFVATDPGVALFLRLASDLDAEGQHHLIGSLGIHLRYPNAHTHWFSSVVLYLFREISTGKFQEITTKVLFERFLVHRPHPWGLIVTFIELLRNPRYDFWNKEFLTAAPEITDLLKHVSRSL